MLAGGALMCCPSVDPQVNGKRGIVAWNELVEAPLRLPADPKQLPDTFVYLCRGTGGDDRICYLRLSTLELIHNGMTAHAQWYQFKEDKAINAIPDDDIPGSVCLRLGFADGLMDTTAISREWQRDLQRMQSMQPYELRVHVYQARNLPATDATGSLDPFVVVSCMGEKRQSSRKNQTCNPTW